MKKVLDTAKLLLPGLLCGAACFAIAFWLIPTACIGWPDPLWIGCKALLPVGAAWLLLGKQPLWTLWPGLLVQYTLLWQLAEPTARLNGIALGGLGGFQYLFEAAVWPLGLTFLQFFILRAARRAATH